MNTNTNSRNTNKLVVPGAQNAINQMKYEIANEFGVQLGPDATARQNGSVGGEITRRLVQLAQSSLGGGASAGAQNQAQFGQGQQR